MEDRRTYTNEFLDNKRCLGDAPADEFISHIFSDPSSKIQLQQWLSGQSNRKHFLELQEAYPDFPFLRNAATLPPWADATLMKTGSAIFARYSEVIMSLLGLLSLPYCYAAANGAMVLYLSEMIRKQTTKRLFDTATFVWEVMAPDALGPIGNGFEEILKVRIIHASIRHYTLKGGQWNDSWGLPINQEDMAGTNLSFSIIVIRGLRLLGFNVSLEEQAAFMHTWAVIGYLTGLNEDLIPDNIKTAQQLEKAIRKRQFRVSDHGKVLTKSLTEHILKVNKSKASAKDILGLMRYLLGEDISHMLAIKASKLPAYKLSLIKTINYLKGFKRDSDFRIAYQLGYAKFKKQSAEVVQGRH
ncbi:MAG: DUF2236 domain-containing protein [Pedobacter sp.]|nr:MAG: DUF2236 domain-containing protein [Pedobacter sp.]